MRALKLFPALFAAVALTACLDGVDATSSVSSDLEVPGAHGLTEPPMLGAHEARDAAHGHGPGGGGSSSPLLMWGGGTIMTSAIVQPIFWGPSWSDPAFTQDKLSGLQQFYEAYAGSSYAFTNTEYTGTNGTVTGTNVAMDPFLFDSSATPSHAPKTSDIQAEVCKMIGNPVANGYYPVYTDIKRGHAGYCAWHSWGSCNGVNVQFGFFFDLDGDSGCDVSDNSGRSIGLTSLANVTGHELSEMMTDPRGQGWTDSSGAENADKCAWKFDEQVRLADGSSWTIQGNWSNAAYNAGTGYPNSNGEHGCLYNN